MGTISQWDRLTDILSKQSLRPVRAGLSSAREPWCGPSRNRLSLFSYTYNNNEIRIFNFKDRAEINFLFSFYVRC